MNSLLVVSTAQTAFLMTCTFYVFLLPTTFEKFGKALNLATA